MAETRYRFGAFTLDARERLLVRDGEPIEISGRYFDALVLLIEEAGRLVTKDRFFDEVWRGVPVTDEALTQCIRSLRRALGDEATAPRLIETVPKHGYRFIAAVRTEPQDDATNGFGRDAAIPGGRIAATGAARWVVPASLGAALAGLIGGLAYGIAAATALPAGSGSGLSALLVLVSLTIGLALVGGAAVALGIGMVDRLGSADRTGWRVVGGALGGLAIGGLGELLATDAFTLLLGAAPGDTTGAFEGLVLGAAIGLGAWLGLPTDRRPRLRRGTGLAGLAGGSAGLLVSLLGGRLLGGSLAAVSETFPDGRLPFGRLGTLLGETGFGPLTQAVSATVEGALFASCLVGAMILAARRPR